MPAASDGCGSRTASSTNSTRLKDPEGPLKDGTRTAGCKLARPLVRASIRLAVESAWEILQAEPGEQLDRIVLSGQTASMPFVRAMIAEQLAETYDRRRGSLDAPAVWLTSAVPVESTPKEAVSVGASWGEAIWKYAMVP
jgi:hypothetical protein